VQRGKRLTKNLLDDNAAYPVYHGGLEPLGKYGQFNREANTVMVINVGASAGTVGFSDSRFWSSDGCFCISHSKLLNNKYLFYYLQTKTHYLQSQVRHAGIPTLDNPVVEKINLPILSISEQERIVGILDTFTSSIDNLKQQIAQRRKQYEYYRNKLLTFED
jgi:type I restriction enzyme S subunit